ncbi:hypothetical protein Ate01nite_37140 [Actinoplanes teichomyceticus]|nr:hypothetical protein Ate01nite_37140 [Actinoplanes teichomyceticus]
MDATASVPGLTARPGADDPTVSEALSLRWPAVRSRSPVAFMARTRAAGGGAGRALKPAPARPACPDLCLRRGLALLLLTLLGAVMQVPHRGGRASHGLEPGAGLTLSLFVCVVRGPLPSTPETLATTYQNV